MAYLWSQFQDFALGLAVISSGAFAIGLTRWAVADPRGFAHRLCGHAALFFGVVALLWAAVVGEKWGWLP